MIKLMIREEKRVQKNCAITAADSSKMPFLDYAYQVIQGWGATRIFTAIATLVVFYSTFKPLVASGLLFLALFVSWLYFFVRSPNEELRFQGQLPPSGTVVGRVSGLFVYPVKSGQAVEVKECELDSAGLVNDRRLMVISKTGNKQTQLTCPKLARLKATFPDPLHILLEGPEGEKLTVSLKAKDDAKVQNVIIIVTGCKGIDLGDEAAKFVDRIMGRDGNRVVRVLDDSFRYVKDMPLWFGASPSPLDRTQFADYGPLLLVNHASLDSINTKIPADKRTGMDRFRANIVVETTPAAAWAEDHWKTVKIGDVVFQWMAPCIRCLQPSVDQITGEAGFVRDGVGNAQPTKALREYHPGSIKRSITGILPTALGGAGGRAPAFGILLTHARQPRDAKEPERGFYGKIKTGDEITVLEYHRPSLLQRVFGM